MKSSRKSPSRVFPLPGPFYFFEVAEYGTLSDPGVPEPKLRADVFQSLSPGFIRSADDVISEIDGCTPLASHFSILAEEHLASIEAELEDEDSDLGFIKRRRLAFLAAALQGDPDTGWRDWVAHEGDAGLDGFKEIIQDWLDAPVEWDEAEWFDSGWSGQSAALGFFSDLDAQVCKALGVVIIEGDRPGSSYYAAELRDEIANANQAARTLGLAFRFRAEGGGAAAEPAASTVVAFSRKVGV
jgi:hypothetical protein